MDKSKSARKAECAICLESCLYPISLPCAHVFCYLCVKGIIEHHADDSTCPVCRHAVPYDILDRPRLFLQGETGHLICFCIHEVRGLQLGFVETFKQKKTGPFSVVKSEDENQASSSSSNFSSTDTQQTEIRWYYSARNADTWWQYDERTAQQIETAYANGDDDVDVQIAGYTYTIDFSDMTQYRADEPMRTRHILRSDNVNDRVTGRRLRGVAGLPLHVIDKRDY